MSRTVQKIISDEEVARVHANANFGSMTPREVLAEGVWKYSIGYSAGHTMMTILREHELITKPKRYYANLTEKGKEYARACATDDRAEITRLRAELAEAREVKPLVWDATNKVYRASVFGVRSFYRIEKSRGSKGWGLLVEFDNDGPLDFLTHWPTLQAAKDAAQADYASRILAALVKGE